MGTTRQITQFTVGEFLLDDPAAELDQDNDLLTNGVIDSLGLLTVLAWLEQEFGLEVDELELAPENFRSVRAIEEFIAAARTGAGTAAAEPAAAS